MMDKNVIFMSAGEINDELAEIKHEYPDVVFLSTNGKAASVLRTGRLIGNGAGNTQIHAVTGGIEMIINVTVKASENGVRFPLLITRNNGLLPDDIPDDLVRIPKGTWLWNLKADLLVSKKSLDAYTAMAVQAAKEGVVMRVTSAYRSYNDQIEALSIQARRYGEKRAKELGAPAGFSEHQLGLALDIGGWIDESGIQMTKNEEVYKWIDDNCYKYGFMIKNPLGKEHITGGIYEPWHIRYIGDLDIARYVHERGITLNEYLEQL